MNRTKIPWVRNTDGSQGWTWNPIIGCSHASEGCLNCYAETTAHKMKSNPHKGIAFDYAGLTDDAGRWMGTLKFFHSRLIGPRKAKKPSRIFVCSMADLFHEKVTRETHEAIFNTMNDVPRHTFILLTKRPERMALAFGGRSVPDNIWLGVSAENQARYDERVPILMTVPAAVRFVSVEPMLESIDLLSGPSPDWVIAGPENGPGARECKPEWIDRLRRVCMTDGIPFFDKREHAGATREMPKQENQA